MPRIGIDLGTTNTLAALVYDDGPHVIPRGAGENVPSVVWFPKGAEGDVVVGREAANEIEPVVRSVKRLMGRTWSEAMAEGALKYFRDPVRLARLGDNDLALELLQDESPPQRLWPHQVSARLLAHVRRRAESGLGAAVDSAVITVPAYFRDPHRSATLDAAREAGLEVAGGDLLDEPSAAALAFSRVVSVTPGEQVLVVDWGGGTFDVTVQSHDGQTAWLQRAIDGDLALGGDDLEHDLIEHVAGAFPFVREVMGDAAAYFALRRAAQQTKEALSDRAEAAFACTMFHPETGRPLAAATTVSRVQLEACIGPRLRSIGEIVERCLAKPDVDRSSIRKVLLVGGSSRIPAFRSAIQALLPRARLHDEVDPMEAVALGAAIYANDRPEIGRICPYGYAFVDEAGGVHDVIPPESPIPTPDYGHYGFRFETRYAAQTVYRVTLQAYTDAGGRRSLHDRQRLFARNMPASAAGAPIDAEIWLDDHKRPQVACYVQGDTEPRLMEGREEGPEELFTRLSSLGLEAEAKVEANQVAGGDLIDSLKQAVGLGTAASESKDREQAEGAIQLLQDNLEQLEAKRTANEEDHLSSDEKAQRRALEWVPVFENEILPKFWDMLSADERTQAIERLRAVRVMARTGAPATAILSSLDEVKEQLFATEGGVLMRAWYSSYFLGMPERMAGELRTRALRCRAAWNADPEERDAALTALHETLAESDAALKRYRATNSVVDASPDLVIPAREEGRGD